MSLDELLIECGFHFKLNSTLLNINLIFILYENLNPPKLTQTDPNLTTHSGTYM